MRLPRGDWAAPSPCSCRLARALEVALFGAIVLLVAAYSYVYHEPWRDEAGAMLEASAVPWTGLLAAMRVEGIPPLFHALLKVLGAFLSHRQALAVAGILGFSTLLFGTHRMIEAISGSRRAAAGLTLALSLTYAYVYELGVVIRQYTLGLGLALLGFAYLRRALAEGSRRALWIGTITCGLAALTSAHSACLAGAALLAFGLASLAQRRKIVAIWPIFLTLPCFMVVVYMALPFPGRTAEGNQALHPPMRVALRLAVQALISGVMPFDWWRAESFVPPGLTQPFAALRSMALWGAVSGAVLAFFARARASGGMRRALPVFDVLAVVLGWPPLLVIIVGHYWGFYRHHLFLAVPAVIVLAAWGLERGPVGRAAGMARRAALVALAPWFVLQGALALGDLALDHRYPFSDTSAAAAALPRGARVVAVDEWRSGGMLFWRPDLHLRTTSGGGRRYLYTRPDASWHWKVPLPPLVDEECTVAPDSVFLAGPASALESPAPCTTPVRYPRIPFHDHPFTWESFELHHVDCACLAASGTGEPPGD